MRIGIDGRELVGQRTGVGRYLAALCTEWLESQDHEYVVYTPQTSDGAATLGPPFADRNASSFRHRAVAGPPGTWWEQVHLPRAANRDSLDVFFAPAYSTPIRLSAPCVVTMHDVSFEAHPEWFRWREGLRRRWLAASALRRAAAVITDSYFSRNEIVRLFDLACDRVHVVRLGITHDAAAHRQPGKSRSSVLYAGSLFNRRHLPTLIRAFAKVVRVVPTAELAIVGANRTHPWQDLAAVAEECGVGARVILHAFVSDEALAALYRRAGVFVFLSEYEGFGLPPLEALAAGVPVIVGDTPVARELYKDAVLFVPHTDIGATAEAIITLLRDDGLRARQHTRATALLPTFNWKRAARETLTVVEAAARARSPW